jgi:transcription elongation GreA/GreB family factor
MSLPIYVTQDKWQDFDDAWTELMGKDEPIDELLVAIKLAGDRKRIARCIPLVKQHVELLEIADRHADAAMLLGASIQAGAATSQLMEPLMTHAEKAWGSEPWWERAVELTGLGDPGSLRKSWGAFTKLQKFKIGSLIFHPAGWGSGEVFDLTEDETVLHVQFQNGRRDYFPLGAALDIFEPLEETDLRARSFRDAEGLKTEIKKEPLEALKAVVTRYFGRATSAAIKNALAQVGIEGSAYSAWWRKAKRLAENSKWFKVSGSGKKVEVHLLLTAADPEEQLRRQLSHTGTLQEVITRAREFLSGTDLRQDLIDIVLDAVAEGAADENEEIGQRLAGWLLLREKREETPAELTEVLDAAVAEGDPEEVSAAAPPLWKLLQTLPTTQTQEQGLDLIIEYYGEKWIDEVLANLDHVPPGMVRGLVERMMTAGKKRELGMEFTRLLIRPARAPHVIVALAKLAEAGKLEGEFPPRLARAQAYCSLAAHLYANRRVTADFGRVHTKLVDLLASGKAPVMDKLLEDATKSEVSSLQRLMQRGVEESIDNLVTTISIHAIDDTDAATETWFWDDDRIWTTRSGLEQRARELKELKEVKIPENEQAIGRAAAMGDISENAEWEAAIEEKGNLSRRLSEMETSIGKSEILENAILPENTVSPGTEVVYRDQNEGADQEITLLGPWDSDKGENVVSYLAPLAQGLLGLHAGDRATIQLPGGLIEVEVLSIKPASVD